MCGRYSITLPVEALIEAFGFVERPNLAPRYNVAPTQDVPVVRLGGDGGGQEDGGGSGQRHLAMLRWGLVPFWAKDLSIGAKMINARAESAAEKPSFRHAFRKRRCLIPADGFYEWKKAGDGPKQPYRITLADGGVFAFAGLWESWKDKESDARVETCTILTTDANERLKPIHHRMPVILPPEHYEQWLTAGDEDLAAVTPLLVPYPSDAMTAYRISTHVNAVRNDDPACIEPLDGEDATDGTGAGPAKRDDGQGQLF